MRNDANDAKTLRDAAWVLQTRRKQTFCLRVMCKFLSLAADSIEPEAAVDWSKVKLDVRRYT